MSIACPYCKATLTPRGLKPGKYQPKCPKCGKPFALVVPADPTGTMSVSPVGTAKAPPQKPPAPEPPPPSVPKTDPNVTGDYTEPEESKGSPKAAAPTDPNVTGDFTDPASLPKTKPDPQRVPKAERAPKPDADDEPTIPDGDTPLRLGGYEVLRVLGRGGMGAVLLGRQVSLDRQVALKVMHPKIAQSPAFVARFTREAYAAAQLIHHNVVQIYDIGEDRGRHFFSMEFVPGTSLTNVIKEEGKLTPEMAVGYVLQAARGLRYGHLQGMVHRDIKPDNLLVNTEGIVKVADLGLVKLPSGEAEPRALEPASPQDDEEPSVLDSAFRAAPPTQLTRVGTVMGTPAYMSPEQSRDSGSVDHRADIYSLGCTLYVLVTGKPPFEGKTALEIISKHQSEPIIPPEVVVKRVPKNLSAILLKMLAKKPEDRYQSMDEVIAVLEGFLGVDRTGPFNPKEEQADQLEKCACQYNVRSKSKVKGMLTLAFLAACVVGILGAAVAGRPALAGGLVGLMLMTPLAYFAFHGLFTGGVVFTKVRALVFGMRFFDWLMWAGGILLLLVTLFLFGLLWAWLGFALLAVGLGFAAWLLTDRPQQKAQEQPLEDARALFKTMRLHGVEEEAVRQFACKFSGSNWESFYEALFGYEAKLAARAYRKGDTGEVSRKAGTWREPIVNWIDARLEARRLAKERKLLQKVEAKALEAEGVSKADAKAQAAAIAADLVDQAAGAKQARKEGKEPDVKGMVASARERRRPKPGYNIAGVKMQSMWFRDFLDDWLGRRLRFVLGAVIFAAGLLWMSQNNLLSKDNNVVAQLMALNFEAAGKGLDAAAGNPLAVSFLPAEVTNTINSYAVPITGLLLMLSGMFYFGWKPSLAAVPGAAIGILGPTLGVPAVGPLSAAMVSLIVGAILIVVVARFLRD